MYPQNWKNYSHEWWAPVSLLIYNAMPKVIEKGEMDIGTFELYMPERSKKTLPERKWDGMPAYFQFCSRKFKIHI